MNDAHSELTSAYLDGELDDAGQRSILSELLTPDSAEAARLARYRLIGDTLRGGPALRSDLLRARVARALIDEPTVLAPQRRPRPWLRPVAGLAIAASVATAAVVIAPGLLVDSTAVPDAAPVAQLFPPTGVGTRVQLASTQVAEAQQQADVRRWHVLDADLEDGLNRLVIEHHEFAGRTGLNGPVSAIGLVSYGSR